MPCYNKNVIFNTYYCRRDETKLSLKGFSVPFLSVVFCFFNGNRQLGKRKGLILGKTEAHLRVLSLALKPVLHGLRRFSFTFYKKVKSKSSHSFLLHQWRNIKNTNQQSKMKGGRYKNGNISLLN